MTGERYLQMLRDELMSQLDILGDKADWFMQDAAQPYCALPVRHWLDQTVPEPRNG
jgi:hypothetical protein